LLIFCFTPPPEEVSFDVDELPASVQLVGLPWSEEALLELGVRFDGARGAFPSPPLGTPVSRSAPSAA
jgi:hypothetical protein